MYQGKYNARQNDSEVEEIEIILDEGAFEPVRGHEDDAGADLKSPFSCVIPARGSVTIDTGVHMRIPAGSFGKLESKSGLNVNNSVVSLGGVIDSGYTGSIVAKLYNMSDTPYEINQGDKVVQIIIQPCAAVSFAKAKKFPKTSRGSNGFGSTGR